MSAERTSQFEMKSDAGTDERIDRLHAGGVADLHFDLPLCLQQRRDEAGILAPEFLPQFRAGGVDLLGVALYVEDRLLAKALPIALEQIARLLEEVDRSDACVLCRSYEEIAKTRASGRIALLLTMEGAEPLGEEIELLRIFYELGLRAISLTHARVNAAAAGGIFAANGSPKTALTEFGRELVRQCDALGIILDLAHINPAGFDDVLALTNGPVIVSHTNARRFYDIERNIDDEQIKAIGARGGVIGVNAILVSPQKEDSTLDRYVDHIEHIAGLIGIDSVGIGFDFCEFIWSNLPAKERDDLEAKLARPHFLPDLTNHAQARNLTGKLIERGFCDEDIEKILRGNWLRILRQLL